MDLLHPFILDQQDKINKTRLVKNDKIKKDKQKQVLEL